MTPKAHKSKHKKNFFERIFFGKKSVRRKKHSSSRPPLENPENPLKKSYKKKKSKNFFSSLFKKKSRHSHKPSLNTLKVDASSQTVSTSNPTKLPPVKLKKKKGLFSFFSTKKRRKHKSHTFKPLSANIPQSSSAPQVSHLKRRKKSISLEKRFQRRWRKIKDKFLPRVTEYGDKKSLSLNLLSYYSYAITSLFVFLGTYAIAYIVYQLTVIIAASTFDIDAVWYYFEVMFPVGNESPLWTPYSIIAITLSGPIISLLLGLYLFYQVSEEEFMKPLKKTFYLWLSFHFLSQFFGAWTSGIITREGFGYVADWMYLNVFYKFSIAIGMLFIMAFIGYSATNIMLETARVKIRINKYNKYKFLFSQAFLPWLIGIIILFLIKIPNKTPQHDSAYAYDMIMITSLGAFIIPMFFNNFATARIQKRKLTRNQKVKNNIIIISLLLLLIAVRLVLNNGLHFIIDFSINISAY